MNYKWDVFSVLGWKIPWRGETWTSFTSRPGNQTGTRTFGPQSVGRWCRSQPQVHRHKQPEALGHFSGCWSDIFQHQMLSAVQSSSCRPSVVSPGSELWTRMWVNEGAKSNGVKLRLFHFTPMTLLNFYAHCYNADALAGIMRFVMSFIAERQGQRRVHSLRDDADWPAEM